MITCSAALLSYSRLDGVPDSLLREVKSWVGGWSFT